MSWMYVGFKIIEPDFDTGMPFEDAYRRAIYLLRTGVVAPHSCGDVAVTSAMRKV